MSKTIMFILIAFYVGLIVSTLIEQKYYQTLYWVGALFITSSILWGFK